MPLQSVSNPKRQRRFQSPWESFFPYYAGYSEEFVRSICVSHAGDEKPVVLDPWNGSGTTGYIASRFGFDSIGADINPVMVIVAKARLLCPTEADSLEAIAISLISGELEGEISGEDPLNEWFSASAAASIRSLEIRIRNLLVGSFTLTASGTALENLSSIAAIFYVALFSVCRKLTKGFKTTNPTWLKKPKDNKHLVQANPAEIRILFADQVAAMTAVLLESSAERRHRQLSRTMLADSTTLIDRLPCDSVDLIITSPPYCTRIDYASATAIELAVIENLLSVDRVKLKKSMIGSVAVSPGEVKRIDDWGSECLEFLNAVQRHSSKASATYYLKTHIDYFHKMHQSISGLASILKNRGSMYMVVQDSYYKDVHNDLQSITIQMAARSGFSLIRRTDFSKKASMVGLNSKSKIYLKERLTTESVLHFSKTV